jgi:hypothetical protein
VLGVQDVHGEETFHVVCDHRRSARRH